MQDYKPNDNRGGNDGFSQPVNLAGYGGRGGYGGQGNGGYGFSQGYGGQSGGNYNTGVGGGSGYGGYGRRGGGSSYGDRRVGNGGNGDGFVGGGGGYGGRGGGGGGFNRGEGNDRRSGGGGSRGGYGDGNRGRFYKGGGGTGKMITQLDTIFVSGMDPSLTDDDIAKHFGSVGVIKIDQKTQKPKIWQYKDKATGVNKGEATVTYDDAKTAESAIKLFDGKDFKGHTIKVQLATRRESWFGSSGGAMQQGSSGGAGGGGGGFGGSGNGFRDREGRENDWICPNYLCENSNFSWRSKCNWCGTLKPEGSGWSGRGLYERGDGGSFDSRGGDGGSRSGDRNGGRFGERGGSRHGGPRGGRGGFGRGRFGRDDGGSRVFSN